MIPSKSATTSTQLKRIFPFSFFLFVCKITNWYGDQSKNLLFLFSSFFFFFARRIVVLTMINCTMRSIFFMTLHLGLNGLNDDVAEDSAIASHREVISAFSPV